MNATPRTEPIQELLRVWTNAIDEPPSATAPSENPTSRIDFIFCRPEGQFRVSDAAVIAEPVASDHRPVVAILELCARTARLPPILISVKIDMAQYLTART
jgi:endonuclease/exonuclease/phosphatase family metal-dependent hydrolase